MTEPRDSSSDSSLDSPVNIRRITPRYEIVSDLPSYYNTDSSYSSASSPVSSLGNESPIRRNIPRAVVINDIEAQVQAHPLIEDDESVWSEILSYYSVNDEEKKPYLSRFVLITIWFSYLIGVFMMRKVFFNKPSPENPNLYFQIISEYPHCQDMRGEIWRFFTSAIVHADLGHILINTLLLYPFMKIIETIHNFKKTFIILCAIAFYSSLVFSYFNPYNKAIGCSNLVFGFNGSLLADLLINYKHLNSCAKWLLIIAIVGLTLLEAISYNLMFNDNVAYVSHWSGWVTGLLFGLILFTDRVTNKLNYIALFFGLICLSYYTIFFVVSYSTNWPPKYSEIFTKSDYPFCCHEKFFGNITEISNCYK